MTVSSSNGQVNGRLGLVIKFLPNLYPQPAVHHLEPIVTDREANAVAFIRIGGADGETRIAGNGGTFIPSSVRRLAKGQSWGLAHIGDSDRHRLRVCQPVRVGR